MAKILITSLGQAGINRDLPPLQLPKNAFTSGENVDFLAEGAVPIGSATQVYTPATLPAGMTQLVWIKQFPPIQNPVLVYASIASSKKLGTIRKDVGLGTYVTTDISRTTDSGVYNNTYAGRWHGNAFQGLGVFNQREDIPQLWAPMEPGTPCVNMPNWITNPEGIGSRAHTIRPYKNFLISMYIKDTTLGKEYPYRVRWSDPCAPGQSPATWDVANPANLSGEHDLAETLDYVVGGATLGDAFLVYKERSVWGMQFVGGQSIMRFWKIFPNVGLLYLDCMAEFPGGHLFVTQDDIYRHTGTQESLTSVLNNSLRKWWLRRINLDLYYHTYTFVDLPAKTIWICYPTSGSAFANEALLWHWDTGVVGIRQLPDSPYAAAVGVAPLSLGDTWG